MSFITSLLYWCMPKNENLRIAARVSSVIALLVSMAIIYQWSKSYYTPLKEVVLYISYGFWTIFSSIMNFAIVDRED